MCNHQNSDLIVPSYLAPRENGAKDAVQTGASRMDRRSFGKLLTGAAVCAAAAPLLFPHAVHAQPPAPPASQNLWKYCDKCRTLFWDGYPSKGRCPKGGAHSNVGGFDFALPHDVAPTATAQGAWRFCTKCNAMFWNGSGNKGRCPAGGGHAAQGFEFVLPHDIPTNGRNQGAWRFCSKCYVMFFDGYPDKGGCPAGGGHVAQGYDFLLSYIPAAPPPSPQLDFDASPIGFKSGIAAGGWSHVTLFPDGRYQYKGHFHDSGAVNYKVASAWMVRAASGVAFEFAKSGSIAGTFGSGSRDLDWNISGTNPEIARNWADLSRGRHGECRSSVDVSIDIADLLSQVKKAVEIAGEVIKVVQVVAQLVG